MKVYQLRHIAKILDATVTDRRKITALVAGINQSLTASVPVGDEAKVIQKLNDALMWAKAYKADYAFIRRLKDQVKVYKAILTSQATTISFDGFKPPYTYTRGNVRYRGMDYRFVCYFNAPSLSNEAKRIDPVFDASVSPVIKTALREIVQTALVSEWNTHRAAITGLRLTA